MNEDLKITGIENVAWICDDWRIGSEGEEDKVNEGIENIDSWIWKNWKWRDKMNEKLKLTNRKLSKFVEAIKNYV